MVDVGKMRLTVTKVVFEFFINCLPNFKLIRLTVTKVVFEFERYCKHSKGKWAINSNKGCF